MSRAGVRGTACSRRGDSAGKAVGRGRWSSSGRTDGGQRARERVEMRPLWVTGHGGEGLDHTGPQRPFYNLTFTWRDPETTGGVATEESRDPIEISETVCGRLAVSRHKD